MRVELLLCRMQVADLVEVPRGTAFTLRTKRYLAMAQSSPELSVSLTPIPNLEF